MGSHFLGFCMLSDVRFYLGHKYFDYSLEHSVLETGLFYIAPEGVDVFVLVGNQLGQTRMADSCLNTGRGRLLSAGPGRSAAVLVTLAPFPSSFSAPRRVQAALAAPVPLVATAATFRAELKKWELGMCGLLPPSALTASKVYISVFRDLRSLFGSGSESVVVLSGRLTYQSHYPYSFAYL